MSDAVRIDKWLWAARFFKTRGLAQKAIANGQIKVDGQRPKPSRLAEVGQRLDITRGDTTFCVSILQVSDRRGSAPQAALLYHESDEDKAARLVQAEQRQLAWQTRAAPDHRPDKRDRRRLQHLKQDGFGE